MKVQLRLFLHLVMVAQSIAQSRPQQPPKCKKVLYIDPYKTNDNFVQLVEECRACQGGPNPDPNKVLNIEGAETNNTEVTLSWNPKNSSVFFKIPQHSFLTSSTSEHILSMNATYNCRNATNQLSRSMQVDITLIPISLELEVVDEGLNLTTSNYLQLLFTCDLYGPISNNPFTSMVLSKGDVTLSSCSNTTHCEWSIPEPDLVKDRGYYFCSAVVDDIEYNSSLFVHLQAKKPETPRQELDPTGFIVGIGISIFFLVVVTILSIVLGVYVRHLRRRLHQQDHVRRPLIGDLNIKGT